jgi:hypothetical protein
MEDFEFNMTVSAMEIAHMVLTGKLGGTVCERVLDSLDISNDEAGCLEQNIGDWLDVEGPSSWEPVVQMAVNAEEETLKLKDENNADS